MSRSDVVVERRHLLVLSSTAAVAACSGDATSMITPRTIQRDPTVEPEDSAAPPVEDVPSSPYLDLDGGIGTPRLEGWRPPGADGGPGGTDVGAFADYAVGTWRLNAGARAIIARDARGVYAYSAICTHERCLVREPDAMGVSNCVCHGSSFDGQGRRVSGPATMPLAHLAVSILGGRVLVDPSTVVADEYRANPPDPDAGLGDVSDVRDVPVVIDAPIDRPVDVAPDVRDAAVDVDPCTRGTDVGATTAFGMNTWMLIRAMGIIVGRDARGIYAFSALCTHQSCTVTLETDGASSCACHGSRFDNNGGVTRGPAPDDLNHYAVIVCAGRVRVDRGVIVPPATRTAIT